MSTPTAGRFAVRALDDLHGADRNPKRHAGERIRASLRRFGIGEWPVVDDRTDRMVAGHGRVNELRNLERAGGAPPKGVTLTEQGRWQVPVTLWTSADDAEAETYLLTSNQSTIAGGWDTDALIGELEGLHAIDPQLVVDAGFIGAELDRLLAGAAPPDDEPKKMMDPAVLVILADEETQQAAYIHITGLGYPVRVVNT